MIFLLILSLISFINIYPRNQSAAYFLMPTRFWEIAIGCLVFLVLRVKSSVIESLKDISPTAVLAGIIGIMFLPLSFALFSTVFMVTLSALMIICLRGDKSLFKGFLPIKMLYILDPSIYSLYLLALVIISVICVNGLLGLVGGLFHFKSF